MNISQRLSISYYKTIATLNKEHNIFLVQHQETGKIYVKKILNIYNIDIYQQMKENPIPGTPRIIELYEENHQLTVIEHYVSGNSLAEIMECGLLKQDTLYHYILELCRILEKMHSSTPPVVHRDIKPSNIIITEYNHVILLDFNAAKYYTESTSTDTILLGTQGYAAPEQYGSGSSSPRTDIYGLGILMKELASCVEQPSPELMEIILKCIRLNPEERFQSVTEIRKNLENMLNISTTENTAKVSLCSYLPPGYRSLNFLKMLIATSFYAMLFCLCCTLKFEDVSGIALWIERGFSLLVFLSVIFICFNYLDIQRFFPMCKHQNRLIRYLGIFLQCIITVFCLLLLMCIVLYPF